MSTLEGLCWASTAGGERYVCIATLKHLVPPTHNKQNGRAVRHHHLMHLAPACPLSKEVFGASKCIWAFMRNCSADIYCGWNNCMRLCTRKQESHCHFYCHAYGLQLQCTARANTALLFAPFEALTCVSSEGSDLMVPSLSPQYQCTALSYISAVNAHMHTTLAGRIL